MRIFRIAPVLVLAVAVLVAASRGPDAAPAPTTSALDLPLYRTTFDNGLELIVSPSPSATAVAVVLTFRVGARDEVPGRSGFAHLFEHMMFQGSAHAPKGEHTRLIAAVGGELNAMTTYDMTQYHDLVPPEHLPLALWLEADRLRALTLTAETLQNQVDAVREELRERIENAAYGPSALHFQEMMFSNWTNSHPTIGDHTDVEAASVDDARSFFERHYGPANAILVISGAVDPDEVASLVHHYFGGLRGTKPPARPDNAETPRTAPRHEQMTDAHARTPAFFVGWQGPPRRHADFHALALLAEILAGGESSRLYQRLVKKEAIAAYVGASQEGRMGPDLVDVTVLLTGAHEEAVNRAIDEEVARLQAELVSPEEMEKVRTGTEASFLFGLRTALGRARLLSRLALVHGPSGSIAQELQRYLAVTREDIQRVARAWLRPEARTSLTVVPGPPAEGERKAAP